jgi:hypothetical protein
MPTSIKKKPKEAPSDPSISYDEWKLYEGQFYKGMKVGRSHKWYYDQGVWQDKKITPDLWEINYAVSKRRAGKAPKGSGVPVGTEYHWYILAHQMVKKLDANVYTTSLSGTKYKVAYRKAETGKWSASTKAQRKRMISYLEEMLKDLKQQAKAEEKLKGVSNSKSKSVALSKSRSNGEALKKSVKVNSRAKQPSR